MTEEEMRNEIDNYETSIHAIVGFANFYIWDDAAKRNRDGVKVFQGRRLFLQPEESDLIVENQPPFVTPDLGILLEDTTGVLAEAKLLFPRDQNRWMDSFRQVMKYDNPLTGWPCQEGKVQSHDIVLITEQGRAVAVRKFYEARLGGEIKFTRRFAIVQCNRSDNRQPYYFFQRMAGELGDPTLNVRLEEGIKVPMKVLLDKYSTIRLYDAEPPVPHMMNLIWNHVVIDDARQSPRFPKLKKKQRLPVDLAVDFILRQLQEGFTFQAIDAHATEGGVSVPKRESVFRALQAFVASKDAEWIDKQRIRIHFQRYDDSLAHFIRAYFTGNAAALTVDPKQKQLFDD